MYVLSPIDIATDRRSIYWILTKPHHANMWCAEWEGVGKSDRDMPIGVAGRIVAEEGLEPTRPCGQRILNPPRLPFRHSARGNDQPNLTLSPSAWLVARYLGFILTPSTDRSPFRRAAK